MGVRFSWLVDTRVDQFAYTTSSNILICAYLFFRFGNLTVYDVWLGQALNVLWDPVQVDIPLF